MKFADMTDKELIDIVVGLHDSIYVTECYGTKDMINYMNAGAELERRGIAMEENKSLTFSKDGIDIESFDEQGKVAVS